MTLSFPTRRSSDLEKGSHLYAVFGASVAHEDEATRAVVAAQAMVGNGAEPSRVRIGIARGAVYVGAYGGDQRMTFGVIGPSVNLAARLMRSEEHTSELQSLMSLSYAVFCLK